MGARITDLEGRTIVGASLSEGDYKLILLLDDGKKLTVRAMTLFPGALSIQLAKDYSGTETVR